MGADLGGLPDAVHGTLGARFDDAARGAPDDRELDFYATRLPRGAGSILDAACGAGRLLVPLLAAGHAMHGAAASATLLEACRARVAAAGGTATLVRQDLDGLNLPFRYAAAFVAGRAFQRLADPVAVRAALARLRAHLIQPGILLLDLQVPSPGAQRLAAPLVELRTMQLADGSHITVRSETTMYAEERIARSRHRYVHRRGTTRLAEEWESTSMTWYAQDEIAALVAEVGFESVEIGPPARAADDGEAYSVSARI